MKAVFVLGSLFMFLNLQAQLSVSDLDDRNWYLFGAEENLLSIQRSESFSTSASEYHTTTEGSYSREGFARVIPPTTGGDLLSEASNPSLLIPKDHLAFFCLVELHLEKAARLPIKFRLGSVDYVDRLEGKRDW